MLKSLLSLAISLSSMQSSYALHQHGNNSNQTPQSYQDRQENKNETQPKPLLKLPISVKPVALPPGDNAWSVQIVSRGGLTGSGKGDLTVTSEGFLIWSGADGSCSRKLADEVMQALARTVLAATAPTTWSDSSPTWLCWHCYETAMVLQRRGVGGVVSASAVSWSDVSQANVPADLTTIYEAVMAHRGCKL